MEKGLRVRNSPMCTLSQNGYGENNAALQTHHQNAGSLSLLESVCTHAFAQRILSSSIFKASARGKVKEDCGVGKWLLM